MIGYNSGVFITNFEQIHEINRVYSMSHPEEIWGHRFQLGFLGSAVSPP